MHRAPARLSELLSNTRRLALVGLAKNTGKTETLTAYPIPDKDESPPQHININGVLYAHEKWA